MTRKDTILIAVIVNACLLAILFLTAFVYDKEVLPEGLEFSSTQIVSKQAPADSPPVILSAPPAAVVVLNETITPQKVTSIAYEEKKVEEPAQMIVVQTTGSEEELPSDLFLTREGEAYVEVTVKKGDSLDKIAKLYGTNTAAIKRLNQLQTTNLSLGQVLKVPSTKEYSSPISQTAAAPPKPVEKKVVKANSEAVYYTVKSGDSPWKIAKQNNVSVDDILRLNNLNEEKARNLKIGDRVRVK